MCDMVKIGILGYGGKIGTALLKHLGNQYQLRLGQRNIAGKIYENAEYEEVDVHNEQAVNKFIRGLTVLVNCTGPSYLTSSRLYELAVQNKIAYIDAFGISIDWPGRKAVQGKAVIGAGSFPGLSGILPLYLAHRYFDKVDMFKVISGSREAVSFGSTYDLIMSSIQGFGKANHYLKDGKYINSTSLPKDERHSRKNGYVYAEYMNQETERVAGSIGACEAHFINLYGSQKELSVMKKFLYEAVRRGGINNLSAYIRDNLHYLSKPENEWYRISCEMHGEKEGDSVSVYEHIHAAESYSVSGYIITCIIYKLVSDHEEFGIKWAYEYLLPEELVENLKASSIVLNSELNIKQEDTNQELEYGDI